MARRESFQTGVCLWILLLLSGFSLIRGDSLGSKKENKQYCSFFNNRAPETQAGLQNCTWFKENSCCQQQEIAATFGRVKPLKGASPACQKYINYLMCYICAPNQNIYYQKERLTVCREFCDSLYEACNSAVLKGSVIHELYNSGEEFCISRRFKVSEERCFTFDVTLDSSSLSTRLQPCAYVIMMMLCMWTLAQTNNILALCTPLLYNALSISLDLPTINKQAIKCTRSSRAKGSVNPADSAGVEAHLYKSRQYSTNMGLSGRIPRMSLAYLLFLLLPHICSGNGATHRGSQRKLTLEDIQYWSQEISKELKDFADKGLQYEELQRLYDSAQYTTEYINGTLKVLEVRDRLGMLIIS